MWMTQMVREVKIQLRDVYHIETTRHEGSEPLFEKCPDGIYPMAIDGKVEYVIVSQGKFIFGLQIQTPPKS